MTTGFEKFSKDIIASLEDAKLNGSGNRDSVFSYSKHLPSLERTGFEAIPHWFRETWAKVRNGGKSTVDTDDPILVLFCEDKNGGVVPKSELKAVHNTTKAYFEFLWTKKRAPACWGDAPLDLRIDFVHKMEEEFEWLRYCDRHWKAEQLFMNYYPQWYRTKTGPRKPKRKVQEADGEEDEGNPSSSKRPRVEEPQPTPPPVRPVSTSVTAMRTKVHLPCCAVFTFANNL